MCSHGGQDEKNTARLEEGGGFDELASVETGGILLYEHSECLLRTAWQVLEGDSFNLHLHNLLSHLVVSVLIVRCAHKHTLRIS